ncbi:MAG: polymer-forming cytoskeletal protein [Desulfobacterales bacterium]|nr:MAG: polymer-forming cytoskeletal protein [Desulfobacterales bacterium]
MALFNKKNHEEEEEIKFEMPVPRSPEVKNTGTYLGQNLKIRGNVSGDGNLTILGTFEGEFDLKGQLKIAQQANVKGNVKAGIISVNGHVDGCLTALERIHLDPTARIEGQITTPKISVMEGAMFEGEIKMNAAPGPPPKPIKKNAKSEPPIPGHPEVKMGIS